MQITMGLPKPCEFSLMLRLHLVQSGIQCNHANQTSPKVRLPITPVILTKLKEHWSPQRTSRDIVMVWAEASVCFFRFWSGKFTIPSESPSTAQSIWYGGCLHGQLRQSTGGQSASKKVQIRSIRKGSGCVHGEDRLLPVPSGSCNSQYMAFHGSKEGPFFQFQDERHLTKSAFTMKKEKALQQLAYRNRTLPDTVSASEPQQLQPV